MRQRRSICEHLEARQLLSADTTPPTATLDFASSPTPLSPYAVVSVTYADDQGLDPSSLGVSIDRSPYPQAKVVRTTQIDARHIRVLYAVDGPFYAGDSLPLVAYDFDLARNHFETDIGSVNVGSLTDSSIDRTPPTVAVDSLQTPPTASDDAILQVTYSDDQGISASTLTGDEIYVTSHAIAPVLVSTVQVDARHVQAKYRLPGPFAPDTQYEVYTKPVSGALDNNHNPLAFADVGGFVVGVAPAIDNPTAALTAPLILSPKLYSPTFTVLYSSQSPIDTSTLGFNDIAIYGPTAFNATFASFKVIDAQHVQATYALGARSLSPGDVYHLSVNPGSVLDQDGNPAAAASLGSFAVSDDVTSPSFSIMGPTGNPAGKSYIDFTVNFTDPSGVNAATIYGAEIKILSSDTGMATIRFTNVTALDQPTQNATSISVTYRAECDGHSVGAQDNGVYEVDVDAPSDLAGNSDVPNPYVGTFTLNIPPAAAAPQLNSAPNSEGNFPARQGSNTAAFTITNVGTRTARGKTLMRLYASADTTLDSHDFLITTIDPNLNLAPGASTQVFFRYNYPTKLKDGSYWLIADVDPNNSLHEQYKTGHDSYGGFLDGPVFFRGPYIDLEGRFASYPQPLQLHHTNTISVRVINHGNITAKSADISVFASDDQTLDPSDQRLFESKQGVRIFAGNSTTVKIKFTPPRSTTAGMKYLIVVVTPRLSTGTPSLNSFSYGKIQIV